MAHYTDELEKVCEAVVKTLAKANRKIEETGGELTAGDVDYVDKLTHALKSIKTTLAMEEYADDYSNDSMGGSYGRGSYRGNGSYNRGSGERMYRDGESYEGGSYARGRGRNAKRDSMGRYSSERGYSYDDAKSEMIEKLHEVMESAPDETAKREVKKLVEKMEQM